jgi:small GTP-binding protein
LTISKTLSNLMIKAVAIGNLSVGKTSLILRYTKNEFAGNYIPTIGADFTTIRLSIDEELEKVNLSESEFHVLNDLKIDYAKFKDLNSLFANDNKIYLWDLAGQPLFRKIRTYYMSNAFFAILIVDLSKPPTFDLDPWIKDLKEYSPNCDYILVGNKKDIINPEDKDVKKQIKACEQKYKREMIQVSAKTGEGVKELFTRMKIIIMQRLFLESNK